MYSINPCIKFLDEIQNDGSVSMTTLTSRRRKWRSLSTKKLKKTRKISKKMSKLDVYFKYLNFIHKFKFFGPPMYQEMGRVQWCLKISILSDIFQQLKHRCSQCRHTEAGALEPLAQEIWYCFSSLIINLHLNIDKGGADQIKNANIKMDNPQNRLRKDYNMRCGKISINVNGSYLQSWVNKCHGLN